MKNYISMSICAIGAMFIGMSAQELSAWGICSMEAVPCQTADCTGPHQTQLLVRPNMPDEKQEITNDDTGIKRSNPQVFNGISVTWTPSMNKCYTRFSGEACSGLESCNPAGG